MNEDKIRSTAGGRWEGPFYCVQGDGFEARFAVGPDELPDDVCNVDAWIHLPDGSGWTATIFTLAEVDRLMHQWNETREAASFWCSDGLIVRAPGISVMVEAIAEIVDAGEVEGAFQRITDTRQAGWVTEN
ncbi:hypothetical protein [Streptacidiphilus carbonis]|uniref:hypothetical protein n=1 Tax=Streptacidiphilus carbonis TaxID=105422 RepID=UPI0005A9024A|nr:hypothetical protein [Streptacidiphilus carbonis]